MKSAPLVSQDGGPGARLMTGRLLNQIMDAVRARTALNAERSTAQGYDAKGASGAAAPPPRMRAPQRAAFQPGRSYVVQPSFFEKLAADLAARTPMGWRAGATPGPEATAAGLRDLMELIRRLSPDAATVSMPQGFRLPGSEGQRTAGLRIEIQTRICYADQCVLAVDAGTQQFEIVQTTVNVYEHGSVTATATASGDIRAWAPGDDPDACAAPVYDNDRDLGFDYGAFLSDSYDVTYAPWSGVWEAAVAGLASVTPAASATLFTWAESEWRAVSASAWSSTVGYVGVIPAADLPFSATTVRWRLINEGQCALGVTWQHRGPGGTLLTSGTIRLPRGATSEWQEPPTLIADPDELRLVTLSGIDIGPYR